MNELIVEAIDHKLQISYRFQFLKIKSRLFRKKKNQSRIEVSSSFAENLKKIMIYLRKWNNTFLSVSIWPETR